MGLVVSKRHVEDYFLSYILQRIERNKNFIMAITGSTGSGKSLAAVKFGEALDPDFSVENVCFSALEFMNLVDERVKPLKRGSVLVWDETQTTMSNKDFLSMQSRMINHVLETFRSRNFVLIFTTPHFSFLDKTTRMLCHSRAETEKIDYKGKRCALKPFLIQVNQKDGKVYEKYLRVVTPRGSVPYKRFWASLPAQELLLAYNAKKEAFNKELNREIRSDLERIYHEKAQRGIKKLTERQGEIAGLLSSGRRISDIASELNISLASVYKSVELIKKKGVMIKPIRKKGEVVGYDVGEYDF